MATDEVHHLVDKLLINTCTDIEKAWALFKWIASNISYDITPQTSKTGTHINKDRSRDKRDSREDPCVRVLTTRRATCRGFTRLFSLMCRAAGLPCEEIEGFAKGQDYLPGRTVCGTSNHVWSALYLAGRWLPADVCWAAGYVDEETGHFTPHFSSFYFLCDPAVFARDHLPRDAVWQCLPEKQHVTMEEFVSWPHVRPHYYTLGFTEHTPTTGVIECEQGDCVDINMKCKNHGDLLLTYRLIHLASGDSHATFVSFKTNDGHIHFRICPPTRGAYRFTVYGQTYAKQEQPLSVISYCIFGGDTYFIKCIPDILWGPTVAMACLNLRMVPNFRSCLITDNTRACNLCFRSTEATTLQFKLLCHKISSREDTVQVQYTVCRIRRLNEVHLNIMSTLSSGSYALAVFVGKDKQTPVYRCVCTYLLFVRHLPREDEPTTP